MCAGYKPGADRPRFQQVILRKEEQFCVEKAGALKCWFLPAPRNANLNENAAFQSEIIDIVYSAVVIYMHCSMSRWGQRIMVEMLWCRRESRRQTEKTNLTLYIGINRSIQRNDTA